MRGAMLSTPREGVGDGSPADIKLARENAVTLVACSHLVFLEDVEDEVAETEP